MSLQELALGAEDDVNQRLLLQEGVKHAQNGRVVVVPLEAVLLLAAHLDLLCVQQLPIGGVLSSLDS